MNKKTNTKRWGCLNSKLFTIYFICFSLCFLATKNVNAQNDSLKNQLNTIANNELPALQKTISISVTDITLGELMRIIAYQTGVNIYLPESLTQRVSSNFAGTQVKDIVYYLCVEYRLKFDLVGNIIRLTLPAPEAIPEPEADITYSNGTLSYNFQNIPLEIVTKKITDLTGINVTPAPSLRLLNCSGFGKDVTIDDALTQLGFGNNFTLRKITDKQIVLLPYSNPSANTEGVSNNEYLNIPAGSMDIIVDASKRINYLANNADLQQLFVSLMNKLNVPYKFLNPLEGTVSVELANNTAEECLYRIFKGTDYTYLYENGICLAGKRDNPGLKNCKVIEMYYRSTDSLKAQLPQTYLSGLEWVDFIDNNSIVLYGDADKLYEFENFIRSIDKRIPLILIDVIIADVSKSMNFDLLLDVGIGDAPVKTSGHISPGVDMTFSSSSINNALDKVGWKSLGQVTPNVYAKIKASEENGDIKIRSTPRLSTLNGKEAKLSIGKKEWYREETNSYIGSLDPLLNVQHMYKDVTAELSVKIRPIVSGDGSVTIQVEVKQSDFTERVDKYGPPGEQSRSFQSTIRVLNNEMVLLGGLEENSTQETTTGLPLIARIPVLKWFFGGTSRSKTESQLTIFIKPTIIN